MLGRLFKEALKYIWNVMPLEKINISDKMIVVLKKDKGGKNVTWKVD